MGKWSQYRREFRDEWIDDKLLRDWIERVADDVGIARCKNCCTILPAHYAGLCNHARSAQHIRCKNTEDMPKNSVKQTLDQDCIHGRANIESKSDVMPLSFDVSFAEATKGTTKRAYQHRFNPKWTVDPLLKDWIRSVSGEVYKARCLWCNMNLPAHLRHLKEHALTKHHTDNRHREVSDVTGGENQSILDPTPVSATSISMPQQESCIRKKKYVESIPVVSENTSFNDDDDEEEPAPKKRNSNEKAVQKGKNQSQSGQFYITASKHDHTDNGHRRQVKQSGCYILGRSQWDRYRQKYRHQWESDPLFQGWLAPVDGDVYKARCLYCRVMFRAHAKDLKDHARTSKHATNVAFGVPCFASNAEFELSEVTPHRRTLSRQRLPHLKKCSRFERSVKSRPLAVRLNDCCSYANAGLLEQDESLATHESLVSMALCVPGYQAAASSVTTLVMPDSSIKLEDLVASSMAPVASGDDAHQVLRVMKVRPGKTGTSMETVLDSVKNSQEVESDNAVLVRLARTATLWEFLKVKFDRRHSMASGGAASVLASMLSEVEMLQHHFRRMAKEQLTTVPSDTDNPQSASDILVIQSEEMAQFLGIESGKYLIKDSSELTARQTMRQRQLRQSSSGTTTSKRGRRPKAAKKKCESASSAMAQDLIFYDASKHSLIELDSDVSAFMMDSHQIIQYESELVGDSCADQVSSNDFAVEEGQGDRVAYFKESDELGGSGGETNLGPVSSADDGLMVVYVSSSPMPMSETQTSQSGNCIGVDVDGNVARTLTRDVVDSLLSPTDGVVLISSTDANCGDEDVGQPFL